MVGTPKSHLHAPQHTGTFANSGNTPELFPKGKNKKIKPTTVVTKKSSANHIVGVHQAAPPQLLQPLG